MLSELALFGLNSELEVHADDLAAADGSEAKDQDDEAADCASGDTLRRDGRLTTNEIRCRRVR